MVFYTVVDNTVARPVVINNKVSVGETFDLITVSTAQNNSLFRDSADGYLKYKDNNGNLRIL